MGKRLPFNLQQFFKSFGKGITKDFSKKYGKKVLPEVNNHVINFTNTDFNGRII